MELKYKTESFRINQFSRFGCDAIKVAQLGPSRLATVRKTDNSGAGLQRVHGRSALGGRPILL